MQKIAEGAYFVPSYSEQTVAWVPAGYTIQSLAAQEPPEEDETNEIEAEEGG